MVLTTENVGDLVAGKITKSQKGVSMSDRVKATKSFAASAKHYEAGETYVVGKDITPQDAAHLIRIGRVVPVSSEEPVVENREKDQAAQTSKRSSDKESKPAKKKAAKKKPAAKKAANKKK